MPSAIIPAALGFAGASLLGGGGGGGGRTTGQGVQSASTLQPFQSDLLRNIAGVAAPQIGQPGRVPPSSLGPVGPSQLQQQAFGFAGGLPDFLQGPAFQPPNVDQITQQFQPTADFARQGFREETIPAIAGAAGFGGGARSSGFQNVLARQGRNLELGLASQLGQQQFGAQQNFLNRAGALPGLGAQISGQLANLGALQRGIPGEQQAFELARFQAADPLRSPAISTAFQAAGIPTQENIAFQGFRQPSIFESILPAAGAIGGGFLAGR